MLDDRENNKRKKEFTFADYWFHFGVLINLLVVLLLIYYAVK